MLTSSLAVFARVLYHFIEDNDRELETDDHLDTLLVIVRYSTLCFDNRNYDKYLSRSLNMINTYSGYIKMLHKKNDSGVLISNDALQLILHRFPATIRCDSTLENAKGDFRSEIAMRVFLDRIKENKKKYLHSNKEINALAEEIYSSISTV